MKIFKTTAVTSRFFVGNHVLAIFFLLSGAFAQAENTATESVMESTVVPMKASGKRATRKDIQKQWQALVNQTLPLATAQLSKANSFYPFAAVQMTDGQVKIISAQDNQATLSPASALVLLRKEIASLAATGRLQAVVYFADAVVTRKDTGLRQTGIRLKLDHASGDAMEGFVPYQKDAKGNLTMLTPEYRPSTNATFQ